MKTAKNHKRMRVVIIGCGRMGSSLASSLSLSGDDVLVIDISKDAFRKLSASFSGLTIVGNATSLDVLAQAQIDSGTTVVCATNYDNTSIMAAQMAKELFSAGEVIVRLKEPDKACVYKEQNIKTVCPAVLANEEIGRMLGRTYTDDN